ncbi:methyl-viologen-reducing hydrogenase subunit delta [Desulfosarcina widdelii]|uniref:Methyl-viologen-reducing hydrogenase subunit delta n=1 Tax=Desulfosarcina widdelii TaxID=947919 RepID=A0A5K7Z0U7_9BACT|nr:hydrogenase iron-sulfur subunit [Desulfosarcina widdelii]BBO75316.1 methyl-viologen-reducing hydrogenase subunit delta [Desulfosarcina widdelii]
MESNCFEPQIVAFCCKYCAYAAADLAGSMRLDYPPNLKIVQLPCSGRVDVLHLLKAIEEGADGVCVAGCLEGECHFVEGNLKTRKKVEAVKKALASAGVEPQRVEMFNLSSAMGPRFAEIATEMTETIRGLGPTPVVQSLTVEQEKAIS